MNTILSLSRSGSCLLSNAALRADTISAFEWPAITILVRRSAIGNIDRAAWRFRHSAPLTFGFQNSAESNSAIHQVLLDRCHFRIFRLCRRLWDKETDADYQHRHNHGDDPDHSFPRGRLIARYPFAVAAAHSHLLFSSNP